MNKKLKLTELNRLDLEEFKKLEKDPIVVLLNDIRSLHNIGSVFRTCDAMAVEKLYLCGITATPPHREIRKTAIGASESVNWEYQKNAIDVIKKYQKSGYQIIAIEQTDKAISLENFDWNNEKILLIFGNEVNGVEQNLINESDISIEIPQWGTKHSFNISVSAGIVLWSIKMQIL
ncbi:MAG: RNA methyltransferase [Crocinitomicaceae bacterium]|nr:RNA methyltransferase [Crocinitomicaceae bacterium]